MEFLLQDVNGQFQAPGYLSAFDGDKEFRGHDTDIEGLPHPKPSPCGCRWGFFFSRPSGGGRASMKYEL
jgi:hypothetical protein